MEKESKYRHEFKYFISEQEIEILRSRLSVVASLDPHVIDSGQYTIRSLYFDNFCDRCYYENENGVDPREKYRIRIYNGSTDFIALECKRKERGKTLKSSCNISEDECRDLIQGKPPAVFTDKRAPLLKTSVLMYDELLLPKVIVEYDRIPYIYPLGNVRITFDTNIRSSSDISGFLEKRIPSRPILQSGHHILEVKYDEFLPDHIKTVLELGSLSQTAFSKYYLCRKFYNGGLS